MADIILAPHSHAFIYVWTDEAIERELSQEFSFLVPGSEYMNKFKKQRWDGRIRAYNRTTKLIYAGLATQIVAWASRRGYTTESRLPTTTSLWSALDTETLLATHPTPFPVREYQKDAITHGLHQQRCVLISPTASGKSLVLYYMVRARVAHGPVLLIVPTITLVAQMLGDWVGYGWTNVGDFTHCITGGVKKHTEKPVVISTWQSIYKQDAAWFARYRTVFGDECHGYRAESLRGIMENLPQCPVRIGVTGTLDDAKANRLMVEGVFGPPYQVATTVDLQTQGHLAPIMIQGHFLQYGKGTKWFVSEYKRRYADEIDYFLQHPGRMQWLVNFVERLPGNVLVLYQFVEKHGIPLYHAIKAKIGDSRPVYFISGKVSGESRERTRALLEQPEHIVLDFGDGPIRCPLDEAVPLSDGTVKPAQSLTTEDDISETWVRIRQREFPSLSALPTVEVTKP